MSTPLCRRAAALAALAAALGLAGCGGNQLSPSSRAESGTATQDLGFARFSDIPVPKGADMDLDHTLVLGSREEWVGRLVMTTSDSAGQMYDFYVRQMPGFGWQPVTSVRGSTSVLTFTRGDRVATVQLTARTFYGSEIRFTVSPRGQAAPGLADQTAPPAGGVQTTPLR